MWLSRTLGIALFLAILAAVLAFAIPHPWDVEVTIWLQRAAPAADIPSAVVVLLGNAEVAILAAVVAGLLLYRRDRDKGLRTLTFAAGLTIISVLAVALKYLVVHPAPPPSLQRHVFDFGLHAQTPYSFPSGHTMRATFIAGIFLRRVPLVAAALVLIMMAGLVYLGDHWASDVLGGLLLGWACVEVARGVRESLRGP